MRIVLRIGGSVVASPINTELISKYVVLLKTLKETGHEVAVVVGGGSLARELIAVARKLDLDERAQDRIAISVSRIFAQLFLEKLGGLSCDAVALTVDEVVDCLEKGGIPVMGGLRPGMTTDTVAALIAERIDANMLVKGTDQNGVYNKDPKKHRDALKLDHLSFDDLTDVFSESKHKAGIHQIIDPEAVKTLKRSKVRLVVVNGFQPENILAAVNGERIGTVVD